MDTPQPPDSVRFVPPKSVTPAASASRVPLSIDPTLERGFVASLRWLVSEGDARGVRRIAVELRALREAIATLDETRAARDDYAHRAEELDRELRSALAILGPGTAVDGSGSLVQRLMKLRERLHADLAARRQLNNERDAWRAMCTLLTQTRARVHELLDETERDRDAATAALEVMRSRVTELAVMHDDAARDAANSRAEMAGMHDKLRSWSDTVDRALQELAGNARALARPSRPKP